MAKRISQGPIRRCVVCNSKSHARYWKDGVCPICGQGLGYRLSLHGGLNDEEITKLKAKERDLKRRLGNKPLGIA